jgi:MoaA/NifB/PqqE/SkfB family radical SAM enzyme
MARIVVELTNRCNLSCGHCYDERHAATGNLPLVVIDRVLDEGKQCGIDHLSFTGGEPTLHPQFDEIVRRLCRAGYTFSLVTNGTLFPRLYSLFLTHRHSFRGVTFSLDGATEQVHDRLRGNGSFRDVMRAAAICVYKDLPFTFNMVLTRQNRHQISGMVRLAARLGSGGLRFGHLMPTAATALRGLDLSPQERRRAEAEIWDLQKTAPLPVGMAPGYFSESPMFPCSPLELEEYNLDYRGNLTLCCHLSDYPDAGAGTDRIASLHEMGLVQACDRFRQRVASYLADKESRIRQHRFSELDHFPCWYCVQYLGKVEALRRFPNHLWLQEDQHAGRSDDQTGAARASPSRRGGCGA